MHIGIPSQFTHGHMAAAFAYGLASRPNSGHPSISVRPTALPRGSLGVPNAPVWSTIRTPSSRCFIGVRNAGTWLSVTRWMWRIQGANFRIE